MLQKEFLFIPIFEKFIQIFIFLLDILISWSVLIIISAWHWKRSWWQVGELVAAALVQVLVLKICEIIGNWT